MDTELISLNKYISSSGFCSRREADELIEQGRVTINNKTARLGARVKAGDVVEIDGEPVKSSGKKRPVYIALNKPVGVTSTTDTKDKTNIIDFIGYGKRIFPIGRLDKDSDGLIFLTNDGDIVNKILRASNRHEKEYIVSVDKAVTPEFITQMGNGIPMLGTVTAKCFVRQEGSRRFRIILTQGLNRQIRRMCEYLGYKVTTLTRVRIMNVQLAGLAVGKWRYLTPAEVDKMNELVAESEKTDIKKTDTKKPEPKTQEKKQYIPKRKPAGKEERQGSKAAPSKHKTTGKEKAFDHAKKSAKPKPKPKTSAKEKRPASKQGAPSTSKSTYKDYRNKRK